VPSPQSVWYEANLKQSLAFEDRWNDWKSWVAEHHDTYRLGRTEKAVHLCFGNYGGQTIQKGTYERLLEFLNLLQCDHLVLETARRPAQEMTWLKDVRPEVSLGIGVIDIEEVHPCLSNC
jgi:methionine synthase II (cobalamin-independent)